MKASQLLTILIASAGYICAMDQADPTGATLHEHDIRVITTDFGGRPHEVIFTRSQAMQFAYFRAAFEEVVAQSKDESFDFHTKNHCFVMK